MSAVETPPQNPPPRGANWLKFALVLSLAVNLLFVGGAAARYYTHGHGPPERISGISQMQLIPRRFLGDLGRDRRSELLKVFRQFAPSFKDGRRAVRKDALKLAAALEAEPYNDAQVKTVIDGFSTRSGDLMRAGGEAALKVISMLSPDERRLLARHIRMRDDGSRRKGGSGKDDDD